MNLTTLHRWHRRLGLGAAPLALAWSLSGVVHPILSSLQPRPATQAPPRTMAAVGPRDRTLAEALQAAGLTAVENARVIGLDGAAVYLVDLPGEGERRGFLAGTGEALPQADRRHAEALARHYLADATSPLRACERLDAFTPDYPYVNRILPAYRVTLDRPDQVVAYVETRTDRLLGLGTPWRARLMAAFRVLHSWHGSEGLPLLRLTLMGTGLALAAVAGVSGLVLYGLLWRRIQTPGTSRWHRRLGLVTGFTTLALAASGFWHLQRNERRRGVESATLAPAPIRAADLARATQPPRFTAVAATPAGLRFRLAPAPRPMSKAAEDPHAHHAPGPVASASAGPAAPWADAAGQPLPEGEAQRAVELACTYARLDPDQVLGVTPVTQFGGEYGFVHKRLPVLRVAFRAPEGDRLYVEPATGALSAWIRDRDAAEGRVFAALHKLDWLAALIGKDPRNGVLSTVAFLQAAVIGLGLGLWVLRRRRA